MVGGTLCINQCDIPIIVEEEKNKLKAKFI